MNSTVPSGDYDQLSLVSYVATQPNFSASSAYLQQVYQSVTQVFGPGTHTLGPVTIPSSYYQIDFVCGTVISQLGLSPTNFFQRHDTGLTEPLLLDRIGHGNATGQMVNLCGELSCAGLPRPKHGVVAPNLGDDSGRHEEHGTTENTEITERKTPRNRKQGNMMEEDKINRITENHWGCDRGSSVLGPRLLESTDHACLAHELRQQGLEVEREKVLPVVSKGVTLDCGSRIDLLFEHTVIVELMAVPELTAIHEAQIL